jgi:selenocysteine lyase/cysteine desulfurase
VKNANEPLSFDQYFLLDPNISYLNHAAVSPWPRVAAEALKRFAGENASSGAEHYPHWLDTEQQLRQRLACLISVDGTREIALTKNTSEALSIIAYGLHWQTGDRVVISKEEFPSNRIIWESLSRFGVETVQVDISGTDPIASLCAACTGRTRLLSVSSVQYATGRRLDLVPLGRHCRSNGILFCVDAIQSLGALPFDQDQIQADFIVADGHKWMMGPEGLALLYVREPLLETLTLHQFGWHMIQHRGDYGRTDWAPATDATRFECGSPNMLGIHTLNASLGLLLSLGIEQISEQLQGRMDYLLNQLDRVPGLTLLSPKEPSLRAGIVTFFIDGCDMPALHRHLMQQGVICAHRGGGIRFSPHFYTPLAAIDRAMAILRAQV